MRAGIVSVVFIRPLRGLLQLVGGDWQQAVGAREAGERIMKHDGDSELIIVMGAQSGIECRIEPRLLHLDPSAMSYALLA